MLELSRVASGKISDSILLKVQKIEAEASGVFKAREIYPYGLAMKQLTYMTPLLKRYFRSSIFQCHRKHTTCALVLDVSHKP